MITFFFSPLYDAILLVGCFVLIRKFILKRTYPLMNVFSFSIHHHLFIFLLQLSK